MTAKVTPGTECTRTASSHGTRKPVRTFLREKGAPPTDRRSGMHAKLHSASNLFAAFVCPIGSSTKSSKRVEPGQKREAVRLASSAQIHTLSPARSWNTSAAGCWRGKCSSPWPRNTRTPGPQSGRSAGHQRNPRRCTTCAPFPCKRSGAPALLEQRASTTDERNVQFARQGRSLTPGRRRPKTKELPVPVGTGFRERSNSRDARAGHPFRLEGRQRVKGGETPFCTTLLGSAPTTSGHTSADV